MSEMTKNQIPANWAIVDVNAQQVDGAMSDVLDIGDVQKKINAFGAKCIEIDGHDIDAMRQAKKEKHKDQPLIILARTCPYKGMNYLQLIHLHNYLKTKVLALM